MRRALTAELFALTTVVASVGVVYGAGPLNPPPGPVTPQYRTLDEVEPRRMIRQSDVPLTITQPGSYYLVENLFAPVLVPALITVSSPDVTIDLRGFSLDGATDVGEATDCITVQPAATGVTIRNGTIRDGIQEGIDCDATGGIFRDLVVTGCGTMGISTAGDCVIESCIANDNGGTGVVAGLSSVVRGCTAARNGTGFSGNGTFESCTARSNDVRGFSVSGTLTQCASSNNGVDGFSISGSATGCSATGNGQSGFVVNDGVVANCTAGSNLVGIALTSDATARGCNVSDNGDVGISMMLRCTAVDNVCSLNRFAVGISVTSMFASGNRIDGNSIDSNDVGIRVTTTGNIIVRNIAHGNTPDYDIVAGNSVGQILDVTGMDITTTNPWRNLSY